MMSKRRDPVWVEIDNRDIPVTAFGGLILPLEVLAKTGFLARQSDTDAIRTKPPRRTRSSLEYDSSLT